MDFLFKHPTSGETKVVSIANREIFDHLAEIAQDKLVCACEPVGETNVVECNCDEYLADFELQPLPETGADEGGSLRETAPVRAEVIVGPCKDPIATCDDNGAKALGKALGKIIIDNIKALSTSSSSGAELQALPAGEKHVELAVEGAAAKDAAIRAVLGFSAPDFIDQDDWHIFFDARARYVEMLREQYNEHQEEPPEPGAAALLSAIARGQSVDPVAICRAYVKGFGDQRFTLLATQVIEDFAAFYYRNQPFVLGVNEAASKYIRHINRATSAK